MENRKHVAFAAILLAGAIGAGAFGWYQANEARAAQRALAQARSDLEQARTDLRAARQEAERLRTALADEKTTSDALRAERATATAFLAAERANSIRVRAELTAAHEQIALLTRGRGGRASPYADPSLPRPVAVDRPMVIRAGPRGSAIAAPAPARAR